MSLPWVHLIHFQRLLRVAAMFEVVFLHLKYHFFEVLHVGTLERAITADVLGGGSLL